MDEFYIGQIFENEYPPECAQWCNQNNLKITELEHIENTPRKFQITEIPPRTEEEEKERIGNLSCTKREFALVLNDMGITYEQIKNLIAENERAQLEWDLCTVIIRKNPLLDEMATKLNISSEQLDNIFKYINGEIEHL
ncbi:hypothetical protein J6S88_06190 [bacterium]|nr:hypothetical protein [bacterium]